MFILLRALAFLPLSLLHMIGKRVGQLVYACSSRYRQRLQLNAALAGYSEPSFARAAAAQTGAMILEIPKVWIYRQQSLNKVISDDEHIVLAARAEHRGILFLTPHLGCFEITARHLACQMPMTIMFRPPRKKILGPVFEKFRNTDLIRAVPASLGGVRQFVRALKRGESVGMLPDQVPSQGEGVWAPFFNRMAYTSTLPGKLAQQTNAIIILTAGERLAKGQGWRIHYVRINELPPSSEAQAQLLNQAMETLIRRFPEQYLWSYNRYKFPRNYLF